MQGWIKVWRKVRNHWYYPHNNKREFTCWEAVIDLWLFRAAGIDNGIRKRGQILTTQRTLAKDWKWERTKVQRFLKKLEVDGEIKTIPQRAGERRDGILITICNYDLYNPIDGTAPPAAPPAAPRAAPPQPSSLPGFEEEPRHDPRHEPRHEPRHPLKIKKMKDKRKNKYTPIFEEFWQEYPMKVDKADAFKAWKKMEDEEGGEIDVFSRTVVLPGLRSWKVSRKWNKDNGDFICHASTFINKKRWESKPEPEGAERPDEAPNWG